jgi:general secretion pathway protein D
VSQWLKAMFANRLTIQDDPGRNALLISGQSAEVTAALEAIQVLDQPLMRSRGSRLINPTSLGADDLARRLLEILTAEGYAVGTGAAPGMPISLLPVPASNALLVFAQDSAVLEHVVEWAVKLDQLDTTNRRSGGNYFSYEVKYADAQLLAKTLQELMGAPVAAIAPSNAQIVIGAPRQPARVVVNPTTNTLIVSSQNSEDYGQLLSLMRTLDRPSKSAMIEVTVAEVTAGTSSQLGIDWSLAPQSVGGGTVIGGTLGGVNVSTGGLSLSYLNGLGAVRARLNALASQNKARILSTPRVMARNGESATIQVGQEVPIVTSQQSTGNTLATGSPSTPAGTSGVLQTIQYRSTGVILKVRPVIFAGRVELDVQQEVSSAASTTTGVNVSPTFSTRKIETKVSIRDGATVALGGLISRNESGGDSGVPGLKDLPWAGPLFRSNNIKADDTELIILITPYVVENDLVAEQVTQALRGQLGPWAQPSSSAVLPEKLRPDPAQGSAPASVSAPAATPTARPSAAAPAAAATLPPPAVGAPPGLLQAPALQGQPAGLAPGVMPAGGVPVTDPALLEELRTLKAGPPSAPSTTATAPRPAKPQGASTPSAPNPAAARPGTTPAPKTARSKAAAPAATASNPVPVPAQKP